MAPLIRNNGYSQKMSGPLLMNGTNTCASYSNHLSCNALSRVFCWLRLAHSRSGGSRHASRPSMTRFDCL